MILGTAGHIDHGKTALVRALTGIDTDRLPEEKRRGITIALGFAPLVLEGVGTVGVVDVPGHEGFVRTMLAGAAGVDLALLVIAADEGVMPQTREHLAILGLLGVRSGVIALSKADLVDAEFLELVTEEVREVVVGTPLEGAPIIPVSALRGAGLDALRAALAAAAREVPARNADDLWRLPVDRVFSVAGAGTVVTGTAWSGTLSRDATVRVLPAGRTARVRSLESHAAALAQAGPGARVALSLVGLDRDEIAHDAVIVRDGDPWTPGRVLRADVLLLDGVAAVGPRRQLRFHLGTAEVGARVVAAGGALVPGAVRTARVVLDAPVVARAGDRFVLRGGSPHGTLGGGVVTDPAPAGGRARPWPAPDASPGQRLGWIVAESGSAGVETRVLPVRVGVRPAQVERLIKDTPGVSRLGDRLVASGVLDQRRAALLAAVDEVHASRPLAPGLDLQTARALVAPDAGVADEIIRRAARAGVVEVSGAAVRRPGYAPGAAQTAIDAKGRVLAALREAGTAPPSVAELTAALGAEVPALLKLLGGEKLAIPVARDRWFAADAVRELLRRLREAVEPGRAYSPADLREPLGLSRKYLIPFLEWCDARRISHRAPDGRTFHDVPESP
jgi:selenocysteine-specific elongation factor